jgi:hypothetical protein
MSQDPNSMYGNNPQNPHGAPQDPYQSNPYTSSGQPGQPGQPPYNTDPYAGQQNPYGAPQNPYAQQNPYGAPQAMYAAPGGYPSTPLPLGEAVKQLPNQYVKVTTRPSVASFAEEIPKAAWDITWVQLVIAAVGTTAIALVVALLSLAFVAPSLPASSAASSAAMASILAGTTVGAAFFRLITVPVGFFIGQGIQYLLAKAFKGEGTFLQQSYSNLLFQVPLSLAAVVLSLFSVVPVLGWISGLAGFALFVYGIVLNVFQIQASHRLTGGKAVGVVLIPYAALIVLVLLCSLIFGAVIWAAIMSQYSR